MLCNIQNIILSPLFLKSTFCWGKYNYTTALRREVAFKGTGRLVDFRSAVENGFEAGKIFFSQKHAKGFLKLCKSLKYAKKIFFFLAKMTSLVFFNTEDYDTKV